MKPALILARAVRALAVPASTMEEACRAAEASGVREPDTAQRLYREWVNDLVALMGGPQFQAAARDPQAAFLGWLTRRLGSPWHVSHRAHASVRARHGDEAAILIGGVRWDQEIAWAHRMRGSDNDRVAFLAEMWLKAARRDPAKLFRGLADVYAAEAAMDAAYVSSPAHLLSDAEILDGSADEDHWRPLWLRFAEREFGRLVNVTPRARLTALAQQVRESEFRDRTARKHARQAEALRRWRPALMVSVLGTAVSRGLSSDDVVAAERAFVGEVEGGRLDVCAEPNPAWRIFARRLVSWSGACEAPGPEESARRVEAIQGLPPSWTDRLPEDFVALGARDHRRLMEWFQSVAVNGSRTPPEDAAVDYGMWLVEVSRGA